jgi:hypothetical protein
MTNTNVIPLNNPEEIDPLQAILQEGARRVWLKYNVILVV